jgi:hypothetical protein
LLAYYLKINWIFIMAERTVQLALPGFPSVIRVKYEQTKGEKGFTRVYQIVGSKDDHITLHADNTLNKHGIFRNLSDEKALSVVKGYESA